MKKCKECVKSFELVKRLNNAGITSQETLCAVFTVAKKYERGMDFHAEGIIQYGFQIYLRARKEKGFLVL